jgi:hypothetical protein
MSLTRFDDAAGASAAMPCIVQDLIAGEGHQEVPVGSPGGDEARALVVPVDGGTDLTLYVRSDNLIMRVSVLLNDDDPIAYPEQIAEHIISRMSMPAAPTVAARSMLPALLETLPPDLPPCLQLYGEGVFDFPALVARFPMIPDAADRLTALGWEASSYRQFTCDDPPASGLNWVDMSVHQFGDAAAAAEAVPYFAHVRTVGTQLTEAPAMPLGDQSAAISGPSEIGTELTLYVSAGRFLLRVTGVASTDDPRPATELVMTALFVHNLSNVAKTEPAPQSTVPPTPVPQRPSPTPSPPPLPTATAIIVATMPPQVPTQPSRGNCDPSYPTVCIPPPPPDLDCRDISVGDFVVLPPDSHNFDGPYDGSMPNEPDGIGCEWN